MSFEVTFYLTDLFDSSMDRKETNLADNLQYKTDC